MHRLRGTRSVHEKDAAGDVVTDTVEDSVHGKVTYNAKNMAKDFHGFEGGFCFNHNLQIEVKYFLEDDGIRHGTHHEEAAWLFISSAHEWRWFESFQKIT